MTYPAKPQAIVAMVLLLVAGCYQPAAQDQQGPAAPANPTVSVKKPELKPLKRIIEQPAQVEAFEETQLIARIPGSVGKVNADIGDIFEPDGLPLAELSVPEYTLKSRTTSPPDAAACCRARNEGWRRIAARRSCSRRRAAIHAG